MWSIWRRAIFVLVNMLPLTRAFQLKVVVLRYAGITIADGVRVVSSVRFITSGMIDIGEGTWVGHEVMFVGGEAPISVGANCDIAPRVLFVTGSHKINSLGPHVAGDGYSLPIKIGDGCWLCAGATILGGTTIGERSIVAAGAVVKGDFPAGSLIGGVPARVLRDALMDRSSGHN